MAIGHVIFRALCHFKIQNLHVCLTRQNTRQNSSIKFWLNSILMWFGIQWTLYRVLITHRALIIPSSGQARHSVCPKVKFQINMSASLTIILHTLSLTLLYLSHKWHITPSHHSAHCAAHMLIWCCKSLFSHYRSRWPIYYYDCLRDTTKIRHRKCAMDNDRMRWVQATTGVGFDLQNEDGCLALLYRIALYHRTCVTKCRALRQMGVGTPCHLVPL